MHNFRTRILPTLVRLTLGAIFTVFGLNGFLHFMPMPPMPEAASDFMGALAATGYMLPLIKGVEVIGGVLLLLGRFVPLALALLAPGIVNIALFHAVLAPSGIAMGAVLLVGGGYLAYCHRDVYRPMLSPTPLPTALKDPRQRYQYDQGLAAEH